MKKYVSMQINKPCNEHWESMTSFEKDKFCNACNKMVKDFSGMDVKEILNYLQSLDKPTCGRIETHQLHKKYKVDKPSAWNWLKISAALVLSFFGLKTELKAQTNSLPKPLQKSFSSDTSLVDFNQANQKPVILGFISTKLYLENEKNFKVNGKVLDMHQHPIQNANVRVKGLASTKATNSKGLFQLNMSVVTDEVILVVEAAGYRSKEIIVSTDAGFQQLVVVLEHFK